MDSQSVLPATKQRPRNVPTGLIERCIEEAHGISDLVGVAKVGKIQSNWATVFVEAFKQNVVCLDVVVDIA
eukprot:Skav213261  [mRNA]  locus=scaffold1311:360074:361104:- [translate_table: standard]